MSHLKRKALKFFLCKWKDLNKKRSLFESILKVALKVTQSKVLQLEK